MGKTHKWDFTQRKNLRHLIQSGYNLTEICEIMNISMPSIRAEVARGCSGTDRPRSVLYDPVVASRKVIFDTVGQDGFLAVVEMENAKK